MPSATNPSLMLELTNVSKSFGSVKVFEQVNLNVHKGEVIAIIGPSGSGKSTLLRCINGLEKINHGSISIEGIPFARCEAGHHHHIPRTQVRDAASRTGMVFQHFNLFPHLTVLQNIMEAPLTVKNSKPKQARETALQLLEKVGLTDRKDAYPSRISGGQKQRTAIARALAMEPDIMLFDEPTSALDPELIGEVVAVMEALAQEHMTMLVVTHDMNFARRAASRILFMDEGRILADQSPHDFFNNPEHERIRSFIEKIAH